MAPRKAPDRTTSDPLPFTQVDRAVKQTAAMIASRLGVTFQHAVGGLVQFWELNGDPRDLEALLAAGKGELVLDRDEVARRFAVAMAVDTDKISPEDLATLRLLERRPDGFRVRGMSRYLKPLEKRRQFKAAATAGGKARSTSQRGPDGRFLRPKAADGPGGGPLAGPPAGVSAGHSAGWSAGARLVEIASKLQPDSSRGTTTEDRVQRSDEESLRAQAPGEPVKPARAPRKPSKQEEFFTWAQGEARQRRPDRVDEVVAVKTINIKLGEPLNTAGRPALERAWLRFLADAYATAQGWPFDLFASQWSKHHNAAAIANSGAAPMRHLKPGEDPYAQPDA